MLRVAKNDVHMEGWSHAPKMNKWKRIERKIRTNKKNGSQISK